MRLGSVCLGRELTCLSCQGCHTVDSGGCFPPLLPNSVWQTPFCLAMMKGVLCPTPEWPSGSLPAFHLWAGRARVQGRNVKGLSVVARRRDGSRVPCCAFLCWFFKCQPLLLIGLHWVAVVSWKGQGRRLAEPRLTEPRPSCHTRLGKGRSSGWLGWLFSGFCLSAWT